MLQDVAVLPLLLLSRSEREELMRLLSAEKMLDVISDPSVCPVVCFMKYEIAPNMYTKFLYF